MLLILLTMARWNDFGLNHELRPIAHLESQYGKYVSHKQDRRGDIWTAIGACGIKPITAYESYKHNLNSHSVPHDIKSFTDSIKGSTIAYNAAVNSHWRRVRNTFPDIKRAVYAWRNGITAAKHATDVDVETSEYVIRYTKLANVK